MESTHTYIIPEGKTPQGLANHIEHFLARTKNMETQVYTPVENGNVCIVQARTRGGDAKRFLGLDKAATVRLTVLENRRISVEIGGAKWIDKGVTNFIGWFVFFPLAITAIIGFGTQTALLDQIRNVTEQYLFQ